jgi:tyrosinase
MNTPTPSGIDPMMRNVAHRGPAFLPWHREFLRRFEQELGVRIPYWDFAADQASGSPESAPVWGSDLMGGNGAPRSGRVQDGPFAHRRGNARSWSTVADPSVPASEQDATVPWLTRQFGVGAADLPTPGDVATALAIGTYDSAPWDATSTPSFRNFLEGWIGPGLHNQVHLWVGGSMNGGTSPNDPVFYLLHANIDRIWANWQRAHGVQNYVPRTGGPPGHNRNDPMQPWGGATTPASVLDTFALGYWYDDAPAPGVASVSPAAGNGGGGTTVVINGSGFWGTTSVTFGTVAAQSFWINSDTQITVQNLPAGDGTVDVVVTTPVGPSATWSGDQFTYQASLPVVTASTPPLPSALPSFL